MVTVMIRRLIVFLFGDRRSGGNDAQTAGQPEGKRDGQNTVRSCCNSYTGNRYDRKYRIFKCPECRQKLRVPRKMGRIKIICRRCRYEFVRKT